MSFVYEFCQGPHFIGECSGKEILTIFEEMEEVKAANLAPIENSYNSTWP